MVNQIRGFGIASNQRVIQVEGSVFTDGEVSTVGHRDVDDIGVHGAVEDEVDGVEEERAVGDDGVSSSDVVHGEGSSSGNK